MVSKPLIYITGFCPIDINYKSGEWIETNEMVWIRGGDWKAIIIDKICVKQPPNRNWKDKRSQEINWKEDPKKN